jgi:hypothetical protein
MRYVVIYEDDQGRKHTRHVVADSQQAAYDVVADEYDAVHGKGAFFPLTVGVGLAAEPNFREQYEAKSGLKKPIQNEDEP